MKKFINQVEKVEEQMVSGLAKAYPSYLRKLDGMNVVVRAHKKEGRVALISGGGSGHEPAHGGYVGEGMLDAAVAGAVFTSPTPDQIYEGIKAVATEEGVLMIVKNYTGDVMNFEMAAELADMEGIKVKQVVVNDDVAVKDSLYTVGRRGVAGTVFVHKIAGNKFYARFLQKFGTTNCAELLKEVEGVSAGGAPAERTAEYYASRPCAQYVRQAAEMLEGYLTELGVIRAE